MKNKAMLPVQHRKADFNVDTIDVSTRTATMVFSTGERGLRNVNGEQFYEELSMDSTAVDLKRLNNNAPLLNSHDSSLESVIGTVERAWLEGGKGLAIVRFASDEKSDAIFKKVVERVIVGVSVGYRIHKFADISSDHDDIPILRAVKWEPYELSVTSIPFDSQARFRSQDSILNEVTITRDARRVEDRDQMKINDQNDNDQSTEHEIKPEPQANAERTRIQALRKLVATNGLSEAMLTAWIDNGMSVRSAKEIVKYLDAKIEEQDENRIDQLRAHVTVRSENSEDKLREAITESFVVRMDPTYKPKTDINGIRGLTMLRSLERLYGRKLGETDTLFAKRAMSSSDFPLILANAAEKTAQNRYQLAPKTYSLWTTPDTLRNYKDASLVRGGDFPSLLERKENAEFQHGSFGEQREVVTLADYGRSMDFSSQSLVNDDLKVLAAIAAEGGVAAVRLEKKVSYAALMTNKVMGDGTVLYHANHGNLGSASAINEASFAEAFKLMRNQKSVDGLDSLNVSPRFLIVGPDKEMEARKFLSTVNPTKTSDVNIYSSLVELIVDSEIAGNQYYFVADPAAIDGVKIFRLEGQESPVIQTRQNWETNAFQFKVAHAVTASPMDWRGLVKNVGA